LPNADLFAEASFPLPIGWGETSPKHSVAHWDHEPEGRARHSVRAAKGLFLGCARRAPSDAPYLQVHGEG